MNISDIFYIIAIIYMLISMVFLIVVVVFVYRAAMYVQRVKAQLLQKTKMFDVFRYSVQFEILQKILQFLRGKKGGDRK